MTSIALTRITVNSPPGDFPVRVTASTLGGNMAKNDSDESLMQRYQRGDNLAFDQLFERHKDAVLRYLERQCAQAAEEIFQDVWLNLIQSRHQYRTNSSSRFTTYLYRIAHNRLMDYFRHSAVKNRVITSNTIDIDDIEYTGHKTPASPDIQVDTHRKIEKLLMLLQELPHEQREAFLLREESGLGIQDIADITGVSRETAKSRLRYAVQRIRDGMRGLK